MSETRDNYGLRIVVICASLVVIMAGLTFLELRGVDLSDWTTLDRLDTKSIFDMGGWVLGGTVRGVASMMSKETPRQAEM